MGGDGWRPLEVALTVPVEVTVPPAKARLEDIHEDRMGGYALVLDGAWMSW